MAILINKESGLAEDAPEQSLTQGTHGIPLLDEQGNPVTADSVEDAQRLVQNYGHKQLGPEASAELLKKAKYSSTGETIKAGAEAVGRGVAGPLATLAETKLLGVKPEDIRGREEANPNAAMAGELAGLVGGGLTGAGEGAALGLVGEAAAKRVAEHVGEGLAGKAAAATARMSLENVLFQAGDETHQMLVNDPNQSAQTALTHMTLSAVLGAGLGVGGATIAHGLQAASPKLSSFISDFKGRYNQLADYPQKELDLKTALQTLKSDAADFAEDQANKSLNLGEQRIADMQTHSAALDHIEQTKQKFTEDLGREIQDHYDDLQAKFDNSYSSSGLKSKVLQQEMPKYSKAIKGQTDKLTETVDSLLEEMKLKSHLYPSNLVAKFEDAADGLRSGVFSNDSAKVFQAVQDFKQIMQGYAKLGKRVIASDAAYDFIQKVRPLASEFREALEDTKVWKKVGKYQKDINSAFAKAIGPSEELESKFMTEINGKMVVDSGKLKSYVNSLSSAGTNTKKEVLKNFMQHGGDFGKVANDIAEKLKLPKSDIASTRASIEETLKDGFSRFEKPTRKDYSKEAQNLRAERQAYKENYRAKKETIQDKLRVGLPDAATWGGKFADAIVSHALGDTAGALGGGLAGASFGHPILGALLGRSALSGSFNAGFKAILKPMLDRAVSGPGYKAAFDYAAAAAKGEKMLNRAAAAVLSNSVKVDSPSSKDIEKLKKHLETVAQDPNKMMNVGGDLGHYLPEHATALASTTANAVQYLQSLKPQEAPLGPLDMDSKASKVANARYESALEIAQAPLTVLPKIGNATLTENNIKDLNALYPGLMPKMQQKLLAGLVDHKHAGKTVPYKTQLGMSMFLGQPLSSSMNPQNIMAAQIGMHSAKSNTMQPAAPRAPHSMSGIAKAPKQLLTTQSAIASRRSNR